MATQKQTNESAEIIISPEMLIREAKKLGDAPTREDVEEIRHALDVELRREIGQLSAPMPCKEERMGHLLVMTEESADGNLVYTHYFAAEETKITKPTGNGIKYSVISEGSGWHRNYGTEVAYKGQKISDLFSARVWAYLEHSAEPRVATEYF